MSDAPNVLRAFQAALRSRREAAGLTLTRMAAELGTTRQNYTEWERSERAPSIVVAERIAQHFGTDLSRFLDAGKETLAQPSGGC